VRRRREVAPIPADALLGLAFSQAMSSFGSFPGIDVLAKRTNGNVTAGEIGTKSFTTSYGSEYTAPFIMCVDMLPSSIV
jgi:hypothetical protein